MTPILPSLKKTLNCPCKYVFIYLLYLYNNNLHLPEIHVFVQVSQSSATLLVPMVTRYWVGSYCCY